MVESAQRRPDLPILVNDIPRLNIDKGDSRLEEFTGDLATPAVGIYSPGMRRGFWLLTDQKTRVGNYGITVEESADRSRAKVMLIAPYLRRLRPTINGQVPSDDRGAAWQAEDEITLRLRLYSFKAPRLQELFDRFLVIRKDLTGATEPLNMIPMSQVFEILEDKLNRENWNEDWGLYSLGARGPGESPYSYWQLGWVGGIQNTLALLTAGNEISRQRARKNLDTILKHSQAPSGFFYCMWDSKHWLGDDFTDLSNKNICLVRKEADALFFFLKQFLLLEKQGVEVPAEWKAAVRRLADAFVGLWKKCGQFGQFIDIEKMEIVIGASTSGAAASAGLALASQYFAHPEYLTVAEQSASLYYTRDVKAGVTTGGPSEALQAPDCESAYALLESFTVLYEITGKQEWLTAAKEQAAQFATWVVSYDFQFPPTSTFARLAMRTTGTVWANGQNKCSVPAICTASGDALLRLYRATGESGYIEMLRDIAQAGPDYMSRSDRVIQGLENQKLMDTPPGWIFERVQMGDWEAPIIPIGETYHWSASWVEAALLLSATENPGVYVRPDKGLVWALDQIDAHVVIHSGNRTRVRLTNRTVFSARMRTLSESSTKARKPLGFNYSVSCPVIELAPGESREIDFDA
jgi:hypothetical protein